MSSCCSQVIDINVKCLCCNIDFYSLCSLHSHFVDEKNAVCYLVNVKDKIAEVVSKFRRPETDVSVGFQEPSSHNGKVFAKFSESKKRKSKTKSKHVKTRKRKGLVENIYKVPDPQRSSVTKSHLVVDHVKVELSSVPSTPESPDSLKGEAFVCSQLSNSTEDQDVEIDSKGSVVNCSKVEAVNIDFGSQECQDVEIGNKGSVDNCNNVEEVDPNYSSEQEDCSLPSSAGPDNADTRKTVSLKKSSADTEKPLASKVKVPCEVCGRLYQKKCLKQHLLRHGQLKNYSCDVCSKTFKTNSCLYNHRQLHHEEGKFICQYCGKFFTNRVQLGHHTVSHRLKRNLQCPLCPKVFCRKHILNEHVQLRHSDLKPFICSKCGRSFKRKQAVDKHMSVHSETRDHSCSICGMMFKAKYTRDKHAKTHSDARDYPCSYCSKPFKTSWGKRKHEKIHERNLLKASQSSAPADL